MCGILFNIINNIIEIPDILVFFNKLKHIEHDNSNHIIINNKFMG